MSLFGGPKILGATSVQMVGIALGLLAFLSGGAVFAASLCQARIIDYRAPVSIRGSQSTAAAVGLELFQNDTISVPTDGSVTLASPDGSVQKYDGPITISISDKTESEKSVLNKLASGLAKMLFDKNESGRAHLVVRDATFSEEQPVTLPQLRYPPRGTALSAQLDRLEWVPIDGATMYTVSLFDQRHLLWRDRTQNSVIAIPADSLQFRSGESFFWCVEAEIGRESLRSEQFSFTMLDSASLSELTHALQETGLTAEDARLAALIRLCLFRNYHLMVDEYVEISALLKMNPKDPAVLLEMARTLESMGMYKEALAFCHNAMEQ